MTVAPVKADTMSHLMNIGLQTYLSGELDARPMLCVGWLYFKKQVSLSQLQSEVLEKLVGKITRYRSVVVERDGWTYFDPLPLEDIDLKYHFNQAGSFTTDEDFQSFLENVAEKGLDYSKPLWKYYVVDKLPCGRSAVLGITDHTLGDGASQMSSLLSMCETPGTNPVFRKQKLSPKKRVRDLSCYEKASAFCTGLTRPISESILSADCETKLKLPNGVHFPKGWRFATTKPENQMDLSMIKAIKTRVGTGCTVNDVMLTLTALVIKRYYNEINDPIMQTNKDITATYAVNTRPAGVNYLSDKWFGNHIVVATTPYPLHSSRIQTLLKFRDESRARKASPDSFVRAGLLKAIARFVPRDKIVDTSIEAAGKFSIMISNVLLSLDKVQVLGQEIDDVQFLAFAPLGCYCGVATYAGKANCNVVVAKECDAHPHQILPYYVSELNELYNEIMENDTAYYERLDKPKSLPYALYILIIAIAVMFIFPFLEFEMNQLNNST